jgi:hypothetical protein
VSSDGCTFMSLKLFIKIPNTFERWEFSIAAESFELIPNTCCIRDALKSPCHFVAVLPHQPTCHLSSAKPLQRQVGSANCNREIEACAELFQMQLRIARGRPVDPFDAERAAFEPGLLQFKRFCNGSRSLLFRISPGELWHHPVRAVRDIDALDSSATGPKRRAESGLCRNSLLEKDLRAYPRRQAARASASSSVPGR